MTMNIQNIDVSYIQKIINKYDPKYNVYVNYSDNYSDNNIIKNDFFAKNNIHFSKLISNISHNYKLYFDCIENVSDIVFNEYIKENEYEDNEEEEDDDENNEYDAYTNYRLNVYGIDNDNDNNETNSQIYKYISVMYTYTEKTYTFNFNEFFLNINNPKIFLYYVTDSYCHILDALEIINNNELCFFNLNPKNIFFNIYYKPILCNFEIMFKKPITLCENIDKLLCKITNFIYYPLEVHILFYLFNNSINEYNNSIITYELTEIISNEFVKNLYILNNYSEKYREKFLKECITFLNQFVNKKQSYIFEKCMSYSATWDNYSLSIIYLLLYNSIITFLKPNTNIYNKIISLLLKNISPNPSERISIVKTKHYIHSIQDSVDDWSFINKIQQTKLIELHNHIL